ncbi:GNAT family N-acetyltransferase [Pelagibaculum spongiae]|uniref:N-acetyltransferase domain-containing protein n=1 Tax=Pelagibaculum spongiae TaxID=2080658 RepID=A0A2V1GUM1_9GAMM|nr:GNAT family N-acetyltransferase [Pelagibaculum spongiae]PVZ69776.1 hypothetical protein DC094_10795 [Pelagibaculum spongiae]
MTPAGSPFYYHMDPFYNVSFERRKSKIKESKQSETSDMRFQIALFHKEEKFAAKIEFVCLSSEELAVDEFDVALAYRGKGYGSLLMAAIFSVSIINHIEKVVLYDVSHNDGMYEYFGFKYVSDDNDMEVPFFLQQGPANPGVFCYYPNLFLLKKLTGNDDNVRMVNIDAGIFFQKMSAVNTG